jgi:hypothetical protein
MEGFMASNMCTGNQLDILIEVTGDDRPLAVFMLFKMLFVHLSLVMLFNVFSVDFIVMRFSVLAGEQVDPVQVTGDDRPLAMLMLFKMLFVHLMLVIRFKVCLVDFSVMRRSVLAGEQVTTQDERVILDIPTLEWFRRGAGRRRTIVRGVRVGDASNISCFKLVGFPC